MNYLISDTEPGLKEFWKTLIDMVEEHYITDEYKDDYLVMGLNNLYSAEQIKDMYLKNVTYRKLIVFQLEPLNDKHWIPKNRILENIKGYDEVWDYDLENIEYLHTLGYDPKFRPMKFTKKLDRFRTFDNPKIDILFFGSSTDSRIYHINHIMWNKSFEYNVAWINGIQDKMLDYFMADSKIILNLSTHFLSNRQAQTRIFYALNNNKFVLSQKTGINYFGDNILEFSNENEMMRLIEQVLKNESWRKDNSSNIECRSSLFFEKSKISIFVFIEQNETWREDSVYIIERLQNSGLFDHAEYIQFSFSGSEQFQYYFHKINRVRYDQGTVNCIEDLNNFARLNEGYKTLYLSNLNMQNIDKLITDIKINQ